MSSTDEVPLFYGGGLIGKNLGTFSDREIKTDIKKSDSDNEDPNRSLNHSGSVEFSASEMGKRWARLVQPGEFEPDKHYYPRVLNAQIHPMVLSFMTLGNERIINRYCHLHPGVDAQILSDTLHHQSKTLLWAGCDLFKVATFQGMRHMIVIETNSCPSGQKSMPHMMENDEYGGYKLLIQSTFRELVEHQADSNLGGLAVVYDKNLMEASGYATTMADIMEEKVFLVEFGSDEPDPPVRWDQGVMWVRDETNQWHSIRAALRYVTQKPWNRFPLRTRTVILNPVLACLAGGRNKMIADRAYESFNSMMTSAGLQIHTPETIRDVSKNEIPLWVDTMGGHAVIKVPYSNAGQGVYTITSKEELEEFMNSSHEYDKFIVQSLVGNYQWSSTGESGHYYHIGTIPNKKNQTFVADLRMMVSSTRSHGFQPVAIYSRRAREPLLGDLIDVPAMASWSMLGTNLSVKDESGQWTTEANRLLLMDRKDFNQLSLGMDDLIDAYVQTVMAVVAVDKLSERLMNNGQFDKELFSSLNPDPILIQEMMLLDG